MILQMWFIQNFHLKSDQGSQCQSDLRWTWTLHTVEAAWQRRLKVGNVDSSYENSQETRFPSVLQLTNLRTTRCDRHVNRPAAVWVLSSVWRDLNIFRIHQSVSHLQSQFRTWPGLWSASAWWRCGSSPSSASTLTSSSVRTACLSVSDGSCCLREREREAHRVSWCVQEHFLLTVIMKSKHKGELFPRHSLRSGWKIHTRRKETFLSRVEVFYHLSFPHLYFHDPELN